MSTHARPWQGTTLAVVSYAATIYQVAAAGFMAFGVSLLGSISGGFFGAVEGGEQAAGLVSGILGGLGFFFAIFVLFGALISYFIADGFWKGKHWPITLTVILGGLVFIMALAGLDPATILITGLPVGLAVSIWSHPFYKQKA